MSDVLSAFVTAKLPLGTRPFQCWGGGRRGREMGGSPMFYVALTQPYTRFCLSRLATLYRRRLSLSGGFERYVGRPGRR